MKRNALVLGLLLLVTSSPLLAVGGKWTPEQLLEHDPAWLRELGLETPAAELWSPEGGGLLEAIVQINGCSSGFVSSEGLIVTNHHCAFSLLQEHSTESRDLIEEGFLAGSRAEELRGRVSRATVPHRFTDVSETVEATVPAGASDLERYVALDRTKKELVATCEEKPFRRCRVATYDDGVRYVLIEALEFRDVRLVYAPPLSVGEYGGEIDNWMWPRHTGDFALLRVYSDADNNPADHADGNRPYRPRRHLQVAREGVREGSFVMVAGYPGRTYRRLIVDEMRERYELYFPQRARLYRDWLDIMEAAGERDEAARLALADRVKRLANVEKNQRGQVAAIRRGGLVDKRQRLDEEVLAWVAANEDYGAALEAYRALGDLVGEKLQSWDRDFLLTESRRGALPLAHALTVTRWAIEREKPDMEREANYQERNRDRARRALERDQNRLHLATERQLLADWMARVAALPEAQRVTAIDVRADALLSATKIHLLEERMAMFEEDVEQLRARDDSMLAFAFALWDEMLPIEQDGKRRIGAISRYRPEWRRAVAAAAGRPVDPDANGTLRISLAHVEGYGPRDGVWMTPLTRVKGMVAKHTGAAPFHVPFRVLEHAASAPESRWAETSIRDVPVCFLATGDTTGGSSGSPVLNGKGELVGVNFDRVWENIANDFGYNPAIARNISADVRFMLWILEEIESPGSAALLEELNLREGGVPSSE